jgi:O-succinylbenzoic acid--CoA ligase
MERAELKKIVVATGIARQRGESVFLCDPQWGAAARARAAELQALDAAEAGGGEGWLCIPTGGTGGGVKFARHDERTLGAAVRGFCAHFGLERVSAVNVLPACHVGGLLPRIRCAATGGEHVAWDWKRLEAGDRPVLAPSRGAWTISLVPTQLQRLIGMTEAVKWLRDSS